MCSLWFALLLIVIIGNSWQVLPIASAKKLDDKKHEDISDEPQFDDTNPAGYEDSLDQSYNDEDINMHENLDGDSVKLPDEPGYIKPHEDLSDEPHYGETNEEHNTNYDHEAFLGEEDAENFSKLSPHEAKEKLGAIVDRIDKDSDDLITQNELRHWIKYVSRKHVHDTVDRQWVNFDRNKDEFITWKEYKLSNYGTDEDRLAIQERYDDVNFDDDIKRDKVKYELADQNKDKKLDKEEFGAFLYPEEVKHMRDFMLDEEMDRYDHNKDGFVDVNEFYKKISGTEREGEGEGEEEENDQILSEKKKYYQLGDKDGDKKLNKEELGNWLLNPNVDHIENEVQHLIEKADTNKDKSLSREEILDHQDLFTGSQATDYGNYFASHDEF